MVLVGSGLVVLALAVNHPTNLDLFAGAPIAQQGWGTRRGWNPRSQKRDLGHPPSGIGNLRS